MPSDEKAVYFFFRERDFRDRVNFFFFGTFAPDRRASERPMAIACLRLLTFLPERPLLSFPRFLSRMARSTFFEASLPYFLGIALLSRADGVRRGERDASS